jgi:hypothetical protein
MQNDMIQEMCAAFNAEGAALTGAYSEPQLRGMRASAEVQRNWTPAPSTAIVEHMCEAFCAAAQYSIGIDTKLRERMQAAAQVQEEAFCARVMRIAERVLISYGAVRKDIWEEIAKEVSNG